MFLNFGLGMGLEALSTCDVTTEAHCHVCKQGQPYQGKHRFEKSFSPWFDEYSPEEGSKCATPNVQNEHLLGIIATNVNANPE